MAALPCNALQCLTSKYFFQTDGTRRLAQIVDVIRRMLGSLPLHAKLFIYFIYIYLFIIIFIFLNGEIVHVNCRDGGKSRICMQCFNTAT